MNNYSKTKKEKEKKKKRRGYENSEKVRREMGLFIIELIVAN